MVGEKRGAKFVNRIALKAANAPYIFQTEQPPPEAFLELFPISQIKGTALIAVQVMAVITLRENRFVIIAGGSDIGYAAHR
jgi:hypothetical protein